MVESGKVPIYDPKFGGTLDFTMVPRKHIE